MNQSEIMSMQQRIRTRFAPRLAVDGFWGPVSQKTCRAYLRSMMPEIHPWPKATQAAIRKFFGKPGDEGSLVTIQFPFPKFYDGKLVKAARIHEKCAASYLRVQNDIASSYGKQRGIMEEAEDFGGIYNFRLKRGGTTYSLHAYGAASDEDADDNTFRDSWPLKADMPLEIIECYAKEGWKSAGAWWGYDAMHEEATQP
jgi:hypothetical protein